MRIAIYTNPLAFSKMLIHLTAPLGHQLFLLFSLDKSLITKTLDCSILPCNSFKVRCINGQNLMFPPSNK